jgi:hypothetical protein
LVRPALLQELKGELRFDRLTPEPCLQLYSEESLMVLLASKYDQSRFFRAEDLTQDRVLRIKSVTEELIGQGAGQKKLVVWFTNDLKGLVLNRTNNRAIRGAYGDDVAGWTGKLIVLFRTHADFGGQVVDALRVRIPPPKQAKASQASSSQEAAKPAAATKPAPAASPEPEADPDLDNEIPY